MRSAGWGPGTGWHGGSGRSRSGRASSASLPTGDGDMRSKPWGSKGSLLLIAALAMALFACSTPSGQAEATPSPLTFGPTPTGQSATEQLVITNVATSGSLTVESMALSGPDAAMFSDAFDDAAPDTLDPGETVTVPVTFSPTASGPRSATFAITHTGTNTPLRIPLSGDASASGSNAVLYRVNAGGPAVAGSPGSPAWSEDSAAAPSPYRNAAATGNQVATSATSVDLTDPSVPAGTPMSLFQSERWDSPASPNLTYSLPVPDGVPVEVRVYVAELHPPLQVVGGRVFDVKVEGAITFRDVDAFARVGANRGLVLSASAVSDGSGDLAFVPGVDNPKV